MRTPNIPKRNNLEWLRLIFALQVVLVHAAEHLKVPMPDAIQHFPGVPAFFFVSGLLIYTAYKSAPGKVYFQNRFLRLFPGLLVVTLGGAIVVLIAHGLNDLKTHFLQYVGWFVAQITLGQAYNPSLFRDVGVGVINGSLWSITTEIIFYLLIPAIVFFERKFRYALLLLIAASFLLYVMGPHLLAINVYREKSFFDVLGLTPLVWGWMFGFGILVAKYYERLMSYIHYAPLLIFPLLLMIAFGEGVIFGSKGNSVGIAYFFCYAGLILWVAFATPYVRLKFDLSYGAYIWHMPIINFLLVIETQSLLLAITLTMIAATLSWHWIERPALKLKKHSIHLKL